MAEVITMVVDYVGQGRGRGYGDGHGHGGSFYSGAGSGVLMLRAVTDNMPCRGTPLVATQD